MVWMNSIPHTELHEIRCIHYHKEQQFQKMAFYTIMFKKKIFYGVLGKNKTSGFNIII